MDQHHLNSPVDAADDTETLYRYESRLKRFSEATANRFPLAFSLFSSRSRTSGGDGQKRHKSHYGQAHSARPSESRSRSSTTNSIQTEVEEDDDDDDDDDDDGRPPTLPALRMARAGFLTSLLSFFSDDRDTDSTFTRTVTPVSEQTPRTDMSPRPRSLGLYEYEVSSPMLYRFSKKHQLYVGWPDVVNPPAEALVEFETETLPLLEQDLQDICAHLSKQDIRITYELRMSGHVSRATGTVTLSPTVWILHRSHTLSGNVITAAALNQVALGLDYLQEEVEIHEGGGRIEVSSDRKLVDVDLDDTDNIRLSNGAVLSAHVEDCQEQDTACGALCCVTVQDDQGQAQQSLSRLGGLLKINGKYVLGVTTAHAMLDISGIFQDLFDASALSEGDARVPRGQAVGRDAIVVEGSRAERWQSATRDAAVDFLGISMNSRGDLAVNRLRPRENATDFALLRLRNLPGSIRNRYVPPGSDTPVSIRSTASARSSALDEGPVHVLCGAGRVADAQLVWGSVCFVIRGRNFHVRRVQTSQPLGPAGSGSWVVRGEVLYGVIIAAYQDEPFALMMTAERLFESILGSAFSIRTVELWDGLLPAEACRPERVGRARAATTGASSSKTTAQRRDSSTRTNGTRVDSRMGGSRRSVDTWGSSTQVCDFQLKSDGDHPAEALGLHPALRGWEEGNMRAPKQAAKGGRASWLPAPTAQLKSYLDRKLPMLTRRSSKSKGKRVDYGDL